MSVSRGFWAVLACFPVVLAHGQQKQVAAPVAGYVFDGSALRPIAGVPGGASLGEAIDLPLAVKDAALSPRQDSAIVTADDGSVHLFRLSGRNATEVSWNGVARGPLQVKYSPSGTAVALSAARRIQVVGGLPDAPLLSFVAETGPPPRMLAREASPAPVNLAVSDDALWLLVASGGGIRAVNSSGAGSVLLEGTRTVSMAFAPRSHSAAVLNGVTATVHRFHDVAEGAGQAQRLPAPGFFEPVGLAFSEDGKSMVAANRGANTVRIFDFASGAAIALECPCNPTGIARLGKLFRLTEASGPVWLVDLGANPPRMVFVPALARP